MTDTLQVTCTSYLEAPYVCVCVLSKCGQHREPKGGEKEQKQKGGKGRVEEKGERNRIKKKKISTRTKCNPQQLMCWL